MPIGLLSHRHLKTVEGTEECTTVRIFVYDCQCACLYEHVCLSSVYVCVQ